MDEREELKKILYPEIDTSASVIEEVLSWHNRHRPKVSREQIQEVLVKHSRDLSDECKQVHRCISDHSVSNFDVVAPRILDDLLSLLNGEKVWCRIECSRPWKWYEDGGFQRRSPFGAAYPPMDIQFCDSCGKERPKE